MQELDEILKKIERYIEIYQMPPLGREVEGTVELLKECRNVIRKHMNDANGTFAFDFSSTDSFDCPCGRHYVHMKMPPKLVFCPECEGKVRNNRTDICPECRKKLYEYEKKYNAYKEERKR